MAERWHVHVIAPHFTAALTIEDNVSVKPVAPILRWTLGKTSDFLSSYFRGKGWSARATRLKD